MPPKLNTPNRMVLGFTGILCIAGITFYAAKQSIGSKRKLDLDNYKAEQVEREEKRKRQDAMSTS